MYRQFFRLVTANVSLWYRDHSTANPLGVEPDRNVTKIVVGNKFSEEGVEIIEHSVGAAERQQRGGIVHKEFEDCRYQM